VIGWGVVCAIIWTLFMDIGMPSDNMLIRLIVALLIFPAIGYFYGNWVWNRSEKKHKEQSLE